MFSYFPPIFIPLIIQHLPFSLTMNLLPNSYVMSVTVKLLALCFYLIISFLQYINGHILLQGIIVIIHPPLVAHPARYAKNARPWPLYVQAVCQSSVCRQQPWNKWGNVSPLDKQQVHLLHATKAADSPSLVFLSGNTIPLCAAPSGHSYHPCGIWGQGGTNPSTLMFILFGVPLSVMQEVLVFCQHGRNNTKVTNHQLRVKSNPTFNNSHLYSEVSFLVSLYITLANPLARNACLISFVLYH